MPGLGATHQKGESLCDGRAMQHTDQGGDLGAGAVPSCHHIAADEKSDIGESINRKEKNQIKWMITSLFHFFGEVSKISLLLPREQNICSLWVTRTPTRALIPLAASGVCDRGQAGADEIIPPQETEARGLLETNGSVHNY